MRWPIVILASTLTVMSCTMSKRTTVFVVPEISPSVRDTVDLAAYEAKYGEYDGVYLYLEHTMEHYGIREKILGGEWNFVWMWRHKYIVFNPEVDWLTSMRIGSKPDSIYMIVTTPDGKVRRYGKNDLKKEKVRDGYDRHTLVYPDIVKGTIIEEGWVKSYAAGFYPPLDQDISLQFSIPCERVSVKYSCPNWWTLQVKNLGLGRMLPVTREDDLANKKTVLKYEAADVPGISDEPYAPFFKEVADYLQLQVTQLEMGGAKYKAPKDWNEIAKRFKSFLLKKSGKGREEVRALALKTVEGCRTDYEKMDAILSLVQNEFMSDDEGYNGNYPKVLQNKKGNIFDLTGLTQSMMEHAGLRAWFILVHSAADGYFDPDYIAIDQLHAPAVRVQVDSVDYVVFPFMKYLPANHTPIMFQGQRALQIEEETAGIWTVPPGNRADNSLEENFRVKVEASGRIEVRQNWVSSGQLAYLTRDLFRSCDEQETEDYIRKLITYTEGEVAVDSFRIENLDAIKEPLRINMYYTIDNLVAVMPDEAVLQTGGLLSPISHLEVKEDPAKRKNPISLSYDEERTKNITIEYPSEWNLSTALEDVNFENEFGTTDSRYTLGDHTVQVAQHVHLKRGMADKSRMGALLELIGSRARLNIPALVFSTVPDREGVLPSGGGGE